MAERVFAMPDLGEGLQEGEIVTWLVAEGVTVELNQPLVEIETAKATVEVPSPFAGVVERLHGAAGDVIAVGAPLVTFSGAAGEVRATPPVRRLAASSGVDLSTVAGSGPQGRVLAEDVVRAAEGAGVGATPAPGPIDGGDPSRAGIARVLSVQAAIPQVTTFRTVDCSALQAFRKQVGSSPLPIVIAAMARVALTHPVTTAVWAGDALHARRAVNVGFAVDTTRGLVVPVVRDVPAWNLLELTAELRRLAHAAREGGLTSSDLADATIAVTNMGSYGSEAGTPILSPGTSFTLGLGVIAPRALVVDDEVQARPACTLSMTFDHRVTDGAGAGAALTDLVALLQSPERLRDLAG
jgi:2-oxoisovalerate dehydrogenase E2 component (dihydrolipoyl transacylase)